MSMPVYPSDDGKVHHDFIDVNISARKAIEKARKFLEQYHSTVTIKEVRLSGKTWNVIMEVGLVNQHILQVKVDSESGRMLGYEQLN
jgi:hypothetical protein